MFRVSKSTYYRMSTESLLRNQYEQMLINEKSAAGKEILMPSENVTASSINQASYRNLYEIVQYQTNVGNNQTWLKQASSSMSMISTALTQIKERAEQMATGTYTGEQRETISSFATQIFETLLNYANVQVDGKYIFAGTSNNNQAASLNIITETPATVNDSKGGNGLIYGQGAYTGMYSRDIELTVISAPASGQSIGDGSTAATAPLVIQYSYYDDYGRQVSGQVNLTGTGTGHGVDVGEGVQIYADPKTTFVQGASYTLEVGRYRGNEQALYGNLSWDSQQQYNYFLSQLYGEQGYSGSSGIRAVASARNDSNSTGGISISGASSVLEALDMEVLIGGLFQTTQGNQELLAGRNYQFTGIVANPNSPPEPAIYDSSQPPGPDNPITVSYTYEDGGTTYSGTVTLYGTGPENTVVLEPDTDGTGFYLANTCYTAADFPQGFSGYVNGSAPSGSNPMPVTYTYIDPQTGTRTHSTINVTKTGSSMELIPPGMGVSATFNAGTYSVGDSWNVQKTVVNGAFNNLLDLLIGWQDALSKDNTVQDYFEAVPGAGNQATSKGEFQISGEWDELKRRGYEFYIGGVAQTSQSDQALLNDRDYTFTVDPGYPGGAPSATNPMLMTVDYTDGSGFSQSYKITVTGTGADNAIILQPAGEGTSFYLANAEYAPGETFAFDTSYDDSQPVSAANPMTITYTYKDDQGVRHAVVVSGITDMKGSIALEPNPESNALTFSSGSHFNNNDSFHLTLEQYGQGQTYSQKLLEQIDALQANLLTYAGDAGAKLNNIEIRLNFLGDETIRVDDRLKSLEDLDVTTASTRYATLQYMYQLGLIGVSTLFSVSLADYM